MPPDYDLSRTLRGALIPLSGLLLIARRRELRSSAVRCAAAFLPYGLAVLALLPLNWLVLQATWNLVDGRLGWLIRTTTIAGLCVGSISVLHLAWVACHGFLARRPFLTLLTRAEACLGLDEKEFHPASESDLRAEAVRTMKYVPILWAILTALTLIPLVGHLIGLVGMLYLAPLLVEMRFFEPLRRMRGLPASGDGTFLDQHSLVLTPFGLSTLLVGALPVVGAVWIAGAVVGAVILFRDLDDRGGLTTSRGWPPIPNVADCAQSPG